jgi:hypothetical protein
VELGLRARVSERDATAGRLAVFEIFPILVVVSVAAAMALVRLYV